MTRKARALARLEEADEAVFAVVAGWHSPLGDAVLPPLSLAASYSRLWMAVSAVTAVADGARGRGAALQALTSVGITSAVANIAMKGLARRPRPGQQVPEDRRLAQPDSSSFPSGHTASAAAFSAVMSAQYPKSRLPINALAATVGFSRVYTGVHYPGDVLAGWVLGKAVATIVVRAWPTNWPGSPTWSPAPSDDG